jgi:hypothetical protein
MARVRLRDEDLNGSQCKSQRSRDRTRMTRAPARVARPRRRAPAAVLRAVALMLLLGSPVEAPSQTLPCTADDDRVAAALADIESRVDPCGETAEVREILAKFRRCPHAVYRICASTEISRNVFDRPVGPDGAIGRTINWNPDLRSELERGCDRDPEQLVRRDPAASLLHEIVHAVQDCSGLNPGEHELEAVRIENIYRRAAGICQRSGYGDDPLPPRMVRICSAAQCSCSPPADTGRLVENHGSPLLIRADGSSASTTAAGNETAERNGDRPE